jgi:hypothetical protein
VAAAAVANRLLRLNAVRARLIAGALASALLLAACGGSGSSGPITLTSTLPTPVGPEGVGIQIGTPLAPVSTTETGATIDGVQCQSLEQLAHQDEVYLQIYIYGHPRSVPGGVGLVLPNAEETTDGVIYQPSECYYWLHTDAADGVILIDTPNGHSFDLGTFFDIWGRRLGLDHLADWRGRVTAIVNGRHWVATPRLIPLHQHETIELAIGKRVPRPRAPNWSLLHGQPLIGG